MKVERTLRSGCRSDTCARREGRKNDWVELQHYSKKVYSQPMGNPLIKAAHWSHPTSLQSIQKQPTRRVPGSQHRGGFRGAAAATISQICSLQWEISITRFHGHHSPNPSNQGSELKTNKQKNKQTRNQHWLRYFFKKKRNLWEVIEELTGFMGVLEERLRNWAGIKVMLRKSLIRMLLPLDIRLYHFNCIVDTITGTPPIMTTQQLSGLPLPLAG